jgi:hypothetical protein
LHGSRALHPFRSLPAIFTIRDPETLAFTFLVDRVLNIHLIAIYTSTITSSFAFAEPAEQSAESTKRAFNWRRRSMPFSLFHCAYIFTSTPGSISKPGREIKHTHSSERIELVIFGFHQSFCFDIIKTQQQSYDCQGVCALYWISR